MSQHLAHSPVICLLSDWIRFKYAGTLTHALCDCVCVIDADTLWVKAWTSRGFMGFAFAGCAQNPSSFLNSRMLHRLLQDRLSYGRVPGDRLKMCFPAQFVVGHPILKTINDLLLGMCPLDGQWTDISDWNHVMDTFLEGVNTHGLRDAIADNTVFCAMHWYWREKPSEKNVILSWMSHDRPPTFCFRWNYSSWVRGLRMNPFWTHRPPPVRPLREAVAVLDHMTDRHQYKQMKHVKLIGIREDRPIAVDFC